MDARQQHPHFTAEGAAARLRSGIADLVVEVNTDESNVYVSAVFAARDYFSAERTVRSLLLNGVDVDPWPAVHLRWAPDQRAWELGVIRDDVINALKLRSSRGSDLSHIVKMRVDGFTLKIYVDMAGMFDHAKTTSETRAQVNNDWSRKIAGVPKKLPEGVSRVEIQIGDPKFDFARMPFASVDVDDFDDDVDDKEPELPKSNRKPIRSWAWQQSTETLTPRCTTPAVSRRCIAIALHPRRRISRSTSDPFTSLHGYSRTCRKRAASSTGANSDTSTARSPAPS